MKGTSLLLGSALLVSAAGVQAQDDREANMAFFLDQPFTGNPSYNIGAFVSDDILLFGSVQAMDSDAMETQNVGAGARFYTAIVETENLGSFWDVSVNVGSSEATNPVGPGSTSERDSVSIGGSFGLEYSVTEAASISARVGVSYTDNETNNTSNDVLSIGNASVQLNFYW